MIIADPIITTTIKKRDYTTIQDQIEINTNLAQGIISQIKEGNLGPLIKNRQIVIK